MSTLRVVTFNIRHGMGTDHKVNLNRVAGVLQRAGGNLAGLQEVDRYTLRSGFCHQPRHLAHLVNQNWVFGPAGKCPGWKRYGNAALSQWPVVSSRNHLMPGSGEKRALLEAEMEVSGIKVAFFCTHLGLNQEDRLKQIAVILGILPVDELPTVLVGDFNHDRDSPEYRLITGTLHDATRSGDFNTFPAENPLVQPDYIFLSHHWRVVSSRPVFSDASDHLAVVAEIALCQ